MGLLAFFPDKSADPLSFQLKFDERQETPVGINKLALPAEWHKQSGVQLTWPHEDTDWHDILKEVTETYISMAFAIASREQLLIVAPDIEKVKKLIAQRLPARMADNITYHQCATNDTWARDHGFLTLISEQGRHLLDFKFNGWGEKFPAEKDNAINKSLFDSGLLDGSYENHLDFVLEGGSIESDGKGTIFTTSGCLLAPHRNQPLNKLDIEAKLMHYFNADRVLWIDHGNLVGDDTDGHIDTLVRIAPSDTLLYVGCNDKDDEQYEELKAMEEQLATFRTTDDRPYRLLKLPMPDAIYDGDDRLPATYANFLVINNAVLYPTYAQAYNDEDARKIIQSAFPGYETIGIDCRTLIKQHGALHCCTMQYPSGSITTHSNNENSKETWRISK